jgi:hypothetical protein
MRDAEPAPDAPQLGTMRRIPPRRARRIPRPDPAAIPLMMPMQVPGQLPRHRGWAAADPTRDHPDRLTAVHPGQDLFPFLDRQPARTTRLINSWWHHPASVAEQRSPRARTDPQTRRRLINRLPGPNQRPERNPLIPADITRHAIPPTSEVLRSPLEPKAVARACRDRLILNSGELTPGHAVWA